MSVYSMTGFANAQITNATSHDTVSIEIRSVNSRFLDLTFRLPDELRQFEPNLRTLLTKHIKRGKVEMRVSMDQSSENLTSAPSIAYLQHLKSLQISIQTTLPEARALSVADVIRMFSSSQQQVSYSSLPLVRNLESQKIFFDAVQSTLDDFLASRQREGERLAFMLHDRIAILRGLAGQAKPMIPELVAQQKQKFLERWREAMAIGLTDFPSKTSSSTTEQAALDRALGESTSFAIRIDVAEELTRLASHLDEIERLLHQGGENGKRFDFLIQELHREANTLGSKSSLLELSRISVEMKVVIEQMREQVQNIE
ncbi:MAG TPA: YicC family protein [Burkholderiaceae bacterium]|nr:YicC family protein [Burkholderiaceae bacterium]